MAVAINIGQQHLTLANAALAAEYKAATIYLIQDLQTQLGDELAPWQEIFAALPDNDQHENTDILYHPEIWSAMRRFGQTRITCDAPLLANSRFTKMTQLFQNLSQQSEVIFANDKKRRKRFKKMLKMREQLYQEMLARYTNDFLQHAQGVLKAELIHDLGQGAPESLAAFDINQTVSTNTPITTASQSREKTAQLKKLCRDIQQSGTYEKEKLALFAGVDELILDDYYFNPAQMDHYEVAWMGLKIGSLLVASVCALGSLICTGLTFVFPGAAVPAFILGHIALVGLVPVAIDLKDYVKNRWFGRAVSSRRADFWGGVVLPSILVPIFLTMLVLSSPILAPVLMLAVAGAKIASVVGYIGGYGLNAVGTLLNGFFFKETSQDMGKRASTSHNAKQLKNHHTVSLAQGVRILNQQNPLSQWVTPDAIRPEVANAANAAGAQEADPLLNHGATPSPLCFIFKRGANYHQVKSHRQDIIESRKTVFWSSPHKSLLYKKVERALGHYKACSADETAAPIQRS